MRARGRGGGQKKAEKLRAYYIKGPVDQIAVKTTAKLTPMTNLMGIFHTEGKIDKVLLFRFNLQKVLSVTCERKSIHFL